LAPEAVLAGPIDLDGRAVSPPHYFFRQLIDLHLQSTVGSLLGSVPFCHHGDGNLHTLIGVAGTKEVKLCSFLLGPVIPPVFFSFGWNVRVTNGRQAKGSGRRSAAMCAKKVKCTKTPMETPMHKSVTNKSPLNTGSVSLDGSHQTMRCNNRCFHESQKK
jgi:hypothetical protein